MPRSGLEKLLFSGSIPAASTISFRVSFLLTTTYVRAIIAIGRYGSITGVKERLMAFIFCRKHKHGRTWYVGYYLDGRFVRKRIGRSKTLAEKARGDIEAKLERGEAGLLNRDYPIRKFFAEYLRRTETRQAPSYHRRNELVIRNFTRFLDRKLPYLSKLSQIRPAVIEQYQRFRLTEHTGNGRKPVTKRTVNIEVSSLKTFLNKAVKWDMLSSNPLQNVEYLKEDDSKRIAALTEEQVRALLEKANGWFRPVLVTAALTGLREGELIHLEWKDVDLKAGVIRIRRKPGWLPKSSGRSIRERDVAIPRELVEFLREHKRKNRSREDDRVFHNKDGGPLRPGLRKAFMRLTRELGFPEVTQFHALRHTYATHLIDACKDIAVAQAQLGHADIRTTMRYSDMSADRKRRAVEMLDYGLGHKGQSSL